MATEYGKRLKLAMAHARLSQKELVLKSGRPQSTVASAINRGSGSADTPLFASVCGVNAVWLATGEGPMFPSSASVRAPSFQVAASGGPSPVGPAYAEQLSHLFSAIPPESRLEAFNAVLPILIGYLKVQTGPSTAVPDPTAYQGKPSY